MTDKIELEDRFSRFLEKHKKLIYKVSNVYCNNYEDRKDLVQEIILQLWKAFPGYDNVHASSTWIYRIALNVSISFIRKETSRRKTHETYMHETELIHYDEHDGADEKLIQLYKFIEQLKPLDRAIIIPYLDGCKNKEIADIMGMTETNISTRLYRIKEKLSVYFKKLN